MSIKKQSKPEILLIKLIILDVWTTYLCIFLGGIEYNPISAGILKHSFILFAVVKLSIVFMIYIVSKYTNEFENKVWKYILKFTNIIFITVVFLNTVYIIFKLVGLI